MRRRTESYREEGEATARRLLLRPPLSLSSVSSPPPPSLFLSLSLRETEKRTPSWPEDRCSHLTILATLPNEMAKGDRKRKGGGGGFLSGSSPGHAGRKSVDPSFSASSSFARRPFPLTGKRANVGLGGGAPQDKKKAKAVDPWEKPQKSFPASAPFSFLLFFLDRTRERKERLFPARLYSS